MWPPPSCRRPFTLPPSQQPSAQISKTSAFECERSALLGKPNISKVTAYQTSKTAVRALGTARRCVSCKKIVRFLCGIHVIRLIEPRWDEWCNQQLAKPNIASFCDPDALADYDREIRESIELVLITERSARRSVLASEHPTTCARRHRCPHTVGPRPPGLSVLRYGHVTACQRHLRGSYQRLWSTLL